MKYALIYIQFDIEYPAGSPLTQSSQNLLKKKNPIIIINAILSYFFIII